VSRTESLAGVFQALSDPKRLEIVEMLTEGERCVCDLVKIVGAKQSLLSFHLKILREAGLVISRRRGKWMYYSLNYETFESLKDELHVITASTQHADTCRCTSVCCPDGIKTNV